MLSGLDKLTEDKLRCWLDESIKTGSNLLGGGYQGALYLFQDEDHSLVIKTPIGRGLAKLLQLKMLRHECNVYSKLAGLRGVPRSYGMLDGRYLVLEYIPGTSFRHAEIKDHDAYFTELLELIKTMHQAGVAHMDLKKKDNSLVVDGRTPYLIDFGVSIIYKPGFAPLNHYLYKLAKKFDFNAWIKLKYAGKYDAISEADKVYLNRTNVEKTTRWIKREFLRITKSH